MMKNREVFQTDPTSFDIPNDGVAKLLDPATPQQWDVLKYELSQFVCDGEYEKGLARIISTYLAHLDKEKQPAAWVSGFYGSGKSHFVRVLECLWRNVEFPDGATARGLARLPSDIDDLLKELSTAGKREGGLWSAAGTLGASSGNSARLAVLRILFQSAGLPTLYAPARFVIWLKQEGYYDAVKAGIEQNGKEFLKELNNLYVSPVLAQSLLDAYPGFATSPADARNLLRDQYRNKDDISDDELLSTMEEVLALQSTMTGRLPCTLLIFDELQQFIGDDSTRTLQVQNIVEACSARFGSRLLFVATGQASLQATPQLSKLQGRFTVRVTLSDTDVEQVVRQVVLRKDVAKTASLQLVLDGARGEVDRHLAGTRIGPRPADGADLVPDYPLLPVRRRFWEAVLRAIDSAGTAGQLRTQLRIVHEATKAVADQSLGTVVAGDFIYYQLKSDMLQSSVLLPEVAAAIERQDDDSPDGQLRSRLCAAIFLIGRLPTDGVAAPGIRATRDTLADLLVDDLVAGSAVLRQCIPTLLQSLVDTGTIMLVGDEYRLQTRESAEWERDYRKYFARIQADESRIASDRATELRNAVGAALKGLSLVQGASKTPRKFEQHLGTEAPVTGSGAVPVWIRDEWSVSERAVRDEAQAAGIESPVVFVLLPRQESDALKTALASVAAAKEALESRPIPTTIEGQEARKAMESRLQIERGKCDGLIAGIVRNARVLQGGGNEIAEGTLQDSVKKAFEAALIRLFPQFSVADSPYWGTVIKRAGEGASDLLSAVGYMGDVEHHPACKEIRTFIGGAGKRGIEIRKRFTGDPYGWPQDAIDGVILTLVACGLVRAAKNGEPLAVKQVTQGQIGVTDFYSEGKTVSTPQRLAVRKFINDIGLPCKPGEEGEAIPRVLQWLIDLAKNAGGDPPLPEQPSTAVIERLQTLSGNEQLIAVYEQRDQLLSDSKAWNQAQMLIRERVPRWDTLQRLSYHASGLPVVTSVNAQVEAINTSRGLLHNPDPVSPLIDAVTASLRSAVQSAYQQFEAARASQLTSLETSSEWQSVSEDARRHILAAHALGPLPKLNIGTDEALLSTLNATPLNSWENMLAALPGRVAQAREEAAKLLSPQAVSVHPPHVTLKTEQETDAYLAELREEILTHIKAGKPVIL